MQAVIKEDVLHELRQPNIEGAVKKLYISYFEMVIAQICASGGTRDDGADIFQEAVLILIEKVKSGLFRGDSSIKTFLFAVARNLWLHELRTRTRRSKREAAYMAAEEVSGEFESAVFKKKNSQTLQEVLLTVGEPCNRILTGYYYEDKSMAELLREFDFRNEQVLRNKKSKCMKRLKELLLKNTELLHSLNPLSVYEK